VICIKSDELNVKLTPFGVLLWLVDLANKQFPDATISISYAHPVSSDDGTAEEEVTIGLDSLMYFKCYTNKELKFIHLKCANGYSIYADFSYNLKPLEVTGTEEFVNTIMKFPLLTLEEFFKIEHNYNEQSSRIYLHNWKLEEQDSLFDFSSLILLFVISNKSLSISSINLLGGLELSRP